MILTGLLLFFAVLYLIFFLGITIFKFKLRRMQRRAEKNADEGRTQYADGEIFYSKNGSRKKHFRQSDGEYVDYEEIK